MKRRKGGKREREGRRAREREKEQETREVNEEERNAARNVGAKIRVIKIK